jgi:hypothetical protein
VEREREWRATPPRRAGHRIRRVASGHRRRRISPPPRAGEGPTANTRHQREREREVVEKEREVVERGGPEEGAAWPCV